jgi:hypothetical protein
MMELEVENKAGAGEGRASATGALRLSVPSRKIVK